jgi:hypothetical protein
MLADCVDDTNEAVGGLHEMQLGDGRTASRSTGGGIDELVGGLLQPQHGMQLGDEGIASWITGRVIDGMYENDRTDPSERYPSDPASATLSSDDTSPLDQAASFLDEDTKISYSPILKELAKGAAPVPVDDLHAVLEHLPPVLVDDLHYPSDPASATLSSDDTSPLHLAASFLDEDTETSYPQLAKGADPVPVDDLHAVLKCLPPD